jgi:hypothetical protein
MTPDAEPQIRVAATARTKAGLGFANVTMFIIPPSI